MREKQRQNLDSTFYMKWKKLRHFQQQTKQRNRNLKEINHYLFTAYIFIETEKIKQEKRDDHETQIHETN